MTREMHDAGVNLAQLLHSGPEKYTSGLDFTQASSHGFPQASRRCPQASRKLHTSVTQVVLAGSVYTAFQRQVWAHH